MKAMSLRIRMQTLSPCLTPSPSKPPAMRAARSATSAWPRRRSPLMMPGKRGDVSVIFFSLSENTGSSSSPGRSAKRVFALDVSVIHVLLRLTYSEDVDGRDKPGHDEKCG